MWRRLFCKSVSRRSRCHSVSQAKDPTRPPTETNLVEYRFTRVTFGLNCSPFLLAGTIKYHLQENTPHKELAKEVYSNVYVDNVILKASNEEEAIEKYRKSKAIFAEMNVNLRRYLTNNEKVNKDIPSQDKSMHSVTKVLGVCWDAVKDHLILNSQLASHSAITKPTISEHIASIYDPMEWLTPLTLRGKLFLQLLWLLGYD
ncbi:hypothetical protein V3C99_002673 [Haemonchus contortus]|uniref:Reverse transcriptase domain-containing protein n=1 Tax=Haemonchus contortus TaxID=6289 RepID=A0A7I4YAD9_HAECO